MTRQVNYFLIGLFILSGIILLVASIIFFGGGGFLKETIAIETYFDGSVQGLTTGSPIKFRGITVGEVTDMLLVGEAYNIHEGVTDAYKYNLYVMVTCKLQMDNFEKFSPGEAQASINNLASLIKDKGLRIRLIPLGITGTAYLELDFVEERFLGKPLSIVWTPKSLYVPSVPSTLHQVTKALSDIPQVLNQDVYPVLRNVNEASKSFPAITEKIDEILTNTRRITADISDVVVELKQNPSRFLLGVAPEEGGIDR